MTVAAAELACANAERNTAEIVRNLIFLTAGGALQPFVQARQTPAARARPRFTSAAVEGVVRHVAATGALRAAPSTVLGNGIEVDPSDATPILAAVAGDSAAHASEALLAAWRLLHLLE